MHTNSLAVVVFGLAVPRGSAVVEHVNERLRVLYGTGGRFALVVVAEPSDDFERWLTANRAPAVQSMGCEMSSPVR